MRIRRGKIEKDLWKGFVGRVVDALSMERLRQADWMRRAYSGLSSCECVFRTTWEVKQGRVVSEDVE